MCAILGMKFGPFCLRNGCPRNEGTLRPPGTLLWRRFLHVLEKMMRFVLMVNKQGQTRLAQYYETHKMDERCALEAEVIRKCLSRTDAQVPAFACRLR